MKFRVLKEGSKNQRLDLDKEKLIDLYVNQQMTSQEVADYFGCTSKTIRNYLYKYGIPIRQMPDAVKLERSKWTSEKELQRSRSVHNAWASKSPEEIKAINNKKFAHGTINSSDSIMKAHQTRMLNGTSKVSKSESEFYNKLLFMGFDKDDIKRNYFGDSRYPYNCDFYIKSRDLFIEFQGHQTHGNEPFDPNNGEHIAYLDACNARNYDMTTWTKRDPKKLSTAKQSGIKLVLVYPGHKTYFINDGKITTIDINDINKI